MYTTAQPERMGMVSRGLTGTVVEVVIRTIVYCLALGWGGEWFGDGDAELRLVGGILEMDGMRDAKYVILCYLCKSIPQSWDFLASGVSCRGLTKTCRISVTANNQPRTSP